jgi:hypothetical protein
MSHRSPNLTLSLPRCPNCNRYWRPAQGVVATSAYCNRCVKARRSAAAAHFGLRPITQSDLQGPYLLPRRFRLS